MSEEKMISWEPSIYVPGMGVIKLTAEQVKAIRDDRVLVEEARMTRRISLDEIEAEASRLTNGFYWSMEWCTVMVTCYCIGGLLGLLFIPASIYAPAVGLPLAIIWYGVWFFVVPRAWRRHAASALIAKYHSKPRYE